MRSLLGIGPNCIHIKPVMQGIDGARDVSSSQIGTDVIEQNHRTFELFMSLLPSERSF